MSDLDDIKYLAWKGNPDFWRGVAAINIARKAGAIRNHDECMQAAAFGSDVALQYGIPSYLGESFGSYACDFVFNGNEVATPPDPLTSFPVFSAEFYLGIYPDLHDEFGRQGQAAATAHWQSKGSVVEGRMGSPVFNVKYYLNNNPDLLTEFGPTGYGAAIEHWVAHEGVDEIRRGAFIFDVGYYLSSNLDIAQAFGAGVHGAKAATLHWLTTGLRVEGRQGSADFSPKQYLASNPDLIDSFGPTGWWRATMHWIANGQPAAPPEPR